MANKKIKRAVKKNTTNKLPLVLFIIIAVVLVVAGVLLQGRGPLEVSRGQSLPDPLESNDMIIPIITRALVMDMSVAYNAAMDSIKINADYLKNKLSMEMTFAELTEIGYKDLEKAQAQYQELLTRYKDERFIHRPVLINRGVLARQKVYLMSSPELCLRLASLALQQKNAFRAKEYYLRIMKRYSRDTFGSVAAPIYRYEDIASINYMIVSAQGTEVLDTYSEIEKLDWLQNVCGKLQEAWVTGDMTYPRQIVPASGLTIQLKKAEPKKFTWQEFAALITDNASPESRFLRSILVSNKPAGLLPIRFAGREGENFLYRVQLHPQAELMVRYPGYGFELISITQK